MSGKTIIEVDPRYFRPTEVDLLVGDATKARQLLGWETKVGIDELVAIMMKHDIADGWPKTSSMQLNAKIYVAGHRGMSGFGSLCATCNSRGLPIL